MNDPLLDDVKALLDKDFGDDRILKQICRACENDEVISNYERNYVKKLAEKHLGRKPEFTPTPTPKTSSAPDVIIPEIQPSVQMQSFQTSAPKISHSKPKTKKILLGIGGLALVVIIAAAASFSGVSIGTVSNNVSDNAPVITESFYVQTDLASYDHKDLISINGVSDTTGTVNLSIKNQNDELVWSEQVSIKNGGKYSTLAIAGGPGWVNSGTYTIEADNGKETKSDTFSFTA